MVVEGVSAETQTNFCLINIFYLIVLHVPPFCSDSGWNGQVSPTGGRNVESSNLQTHLPPKQWKPLLLPHIAAVRRLINPSEWTFKHARQTPHFQHCTFHKQIGSNRWKANMISHECGELLCTWKTLWKHSWKCCEKNIIASSHSGLRTVGQHCCDAVLRSFGWNARAKMMNIRFFIFSEAPGIALFLDAWIASLHKFEMKGLETSKFDLDNGPPNDVAMQTILDHINSWVVCLKQRIAEWWCRE